jgi:hypothetical protein
MNKKILTSALGLVAAAGLAGGSTFAGWSDNFTEDSNTVGAGEIVLNVADGAPVTQEFDRLNLIPGGQADSEYVVTSMSSNASGPDASSLAAHLTLTLENLLGTEDGCSNTNGEEDDDPDCVTPGTDGAGDNIYGDFDDDARVVINVTAPGTVADACDRPAGGLGGVWNGVVTLRQLATMGPVDLLKGDTLAQGEGICVRMAIALPSTVDNASQGDSADFDVRFDLTQDV